MGPETASGGLRLSLLRSALARTLTAAVVALAVGGLAACGDDAERSSPAAGTADAPGRSGKLVWAFAERPRQIDPLLAERRADQLISRQVHEPLVTELAGPFGDVRRLPGLVLSSRPSRDRTIWRLRLRTGVRFQDGTRFEADAVLANARRWQTMEEGSEVLGQEFEVDAPAPDIVQFILSQPDPDLPERLSDPRLGIVSPRALDPPSGEGARFKRTGVSGTGPFELRERDASRVLIARNVGWWGSRRGLGPAFDQVEFRVVPKVKQRLALLRSGQVQLAEDLGRRGLRAIARDPLLSALGGKRERLGLERSVRGISSARAIPSLSSAWRTTIGAG